MNIDISLLKMRRLLGRSAIAAFLYGALAMPGDTRAATSEIKTALHLADLLRAARTVIANNQALINDPKTEDKGLTGDVVVQKALAIFQTRTGNTISLGDNATLQGRLFTAQAASIREVMDEHQSTINKGGLGFKGFVPAVFARLVNEKFKTKMGRIAEVKVTAPIELVRNRKARPDRWEHEVFRNILANGQWPEGKLYSAMAQNDGRDAFRVLVPEYYGKGCLTCHGGPAGEIDITGHPKEGGKEGWLAGGISITLFRQ